MRDVGKGCGWSGKVMSVSEEWGECCAIKQSVDAGLKIHPTRHCIHTHTSPLLYTQFDW